MYIDIRDFNKNEFGSTTVYTRARHINLYFYWNDENNKFVVFKIDNNIMDLQNKKIKELQLIDIEKQKTGFGYKSFFKCPCCGTKRQNLYFIENELKFICRCCIDKNVYKFRTNMYDGNIENIIRYKIRGILKSLGATNPSVDMINFSSNIPYKPKYMRWDKYSLCVKRIYFLHYIYWQHVVGGMKDVKPKDLKDMLEENNVNFIWELVLYPQYFGELEEVAKSLKKLVKTRHNNLYKK